MVLAKDLEPTITEQTTVDPDAVEPTAVEPFEAGTDYFPPLPPTELYSDEPPLESDLHLRQILLLISSLEWLWKDRLDFFASGNLTVYFSPKQLKYRDFRGPDFLVVLNTERRSRKSWTVWEEDGKYPNVIVEILSDSTANVDRTTKKALYQDTFRLPEYFWFDPVSLEFAGFILVGGQYEPIAPNEEGHLWSQQLELFLGIHEEKLRYFIGSGTLVPSLEEAAESAQQAAELAQQKAERLADKLKSLGVDPDTL
ncbi:MAG: Uma2 family endonuclease [Cyanobacteria bacterium J06623_5]